MECFFYVGTVINTSLLPSRIRKHQAEEDKITREEQIEGEELKRLAAQYELEKKRLEEIREAEARQLMADNLKQINDVEKMKTVARMQEEVSKVTLTGAYPTW